MARPRRDEGFSTMKIIVIVAILMILSGILVPLYAWFADRAKISEVTENLAAICEAQVSYRAEHGTYHPCKESPANGGTDNIPDPWVDEGTPDTDAFADIGFRPEGPVRYKYNVTNVTETAFTAIATGDLDEDGKPARFIVYKLHPRYPEPIRTGDRW
ncbi:type IV pilin protein [Candidatus Poribacteria bacterium]